MSNLIIREVTQDDAPALSRICLLTADAGVSAEVLHDHKELPGLVYAVPYVNLPTTWGFVLDDKSKNKVVGYILGSVDTRAYEQHAAQDWWPPLVEKYSSVTPTKPADDRYINLLKNMHVAPDSNIAFSPAHMHIDILEDYQGRGWGRKLITTAIDHLKERGLQGVWLGLDPRNENARKFYERLGFEQIKDAPDVNQLGIKFSKYR
ncbi:acyl-CoA N-acyltransferase [Crucibulum laeve]|uniref:Acyl-CoA N-acyltransferase n=1 Tax=Crucibulum laeve TaxID=68775 RepID=A0A5C3MD74_9AGAR|nr:acyl-CoA N-acyltransferase [Crucibulum laeve]